MPRKFFDNLLDSGTPDEKKGRRRALTLPVSIAIHVVVLIALVVVPLLTLNELPEPVGDNTVRAFFVDSAPPPPPPPPPAAAAPKPKTVVPPKVEEPKPVVVEEPKFTAPIEVPKEIPQEAAVAAGQAGGVVGGVPEGVPGGEVGGVKGGVVGGEIGGVEGGELGGVKGGVIGGVPTEEPPPPPNVPVRVGGQIKAPRKLKDVAPKYTDLAREARVSSVVILEAVIGTDGRVDLVKVMRGHPLLNDSAVAAVKQWVYSPTTLNGTPVAVIMTVTVNFKIE